MKRVDIRQKLQSLGVALDGIILGKFDELGELTAKKKRSPESPLYRSAGAFFRPNYERGILIDALIKRYQISTYLEIGFGRGYSALCAARAMVEAGIKGQVVTIDPNFDSAHLDMLYRELPTPWFERMEFVSGKSQEVLANLDASVEFVYIDGDHSYSGTKADWMWTKKHFTKFCLFDDYQAAAKMGDELECRMAIDEIDDFEKELLIMDRRIFTDDRRVADNDIDYGQVLITHPSLKP